MPLDTCRRFRTLGSPEWRGGSYIVADSFARGVWNAANCGFLGERRGRSGPSRGGEPGGWAPYGTMSPETDPTPIDAAIARIAARQHGVVSLYQLIQLGLTDSGVRKRVRAGRLHPIHR